MWNHFNTYLEKWLIQWWVISDLGEIRFHGAFWKLVYMRCNDIFRGILVLRRNTPPCGSLFRGIKWRFVFEYVESGISDSLEWTIVRFLNKIRIYLSDGGDSMLETSHRGWRLWNLIAIKIVARVLSIVTIVWTMNNTSNGWKFGGERLVFWCIWIRSQCSAKNLMNTL